MPSFNVARALRIAFVLGVAGCGSVALVPDGGGSDGGTGKAGASGSAGSTGAAGATGSAGTTMTGGAGATGAAGTTMTGGAGTTGAAGMTGGAGSTGTAGAGGAAGHAGTGGGGTTGSAGSGGGCICPASYVPVCGTDNKTYGNQCEANCAGVMVAYQGECMKSSTITLKVNVPADHPYCDQTMGCTGPTHFQILTADGKALTFSQPICTVSCSSTCQAAICPLGVCIAPHGTMFTGTSMDWDGSYYTMSTCGNMVGCYQKNQAPQGKYIARMCGTPGKLDNPDAGFQANCVASGAQVCVDVPFDYPGPTPVVGKLP